MKKTGSEGSMLPGSTPVIADKYDGREIKREKQPVTNASAGHTGPGGAKNSSDVGGNSEAALKQLRYGNS